MRHRKKTPSNGNTIIFTAGAPGSEGIKLEFTRNLGVSKPPPENMDNVMNKHIRDALENALWSKDPEIRKKAVKTLVRNAVKEGKMYEIRKLLDNYSRDVTKDVHAELDELIRERGKEPL